MANAIGKLQSKFTVYCTICTQPITRSASVRIYSKDESEINAAKVELTNRLSKHYTCNICKSILNA